MARRVLVVPAADGLDGDLAQLGETFNKMTQELRTQRDELVNASETIDSRRRFIEARAARGRSLAPQF